MEGEGAVMGQWSFVTANILCRAVLPAKVDDPAVKLAIPAVRAGFPGQARE